MEACVGNLRSRLPLQHHVSSRPQPRKGTKTDQGGGDGENDSHVGVSPLSRHSVQNAAGKNRAAVRHASVIRAAGKLMKQRKVCSACLQLKNGSEIGRTAGGREAIKDGTALHQLPVWITSVAGIARKRPQKGKIAAGCVDLENCSFVARSA